MGEAVALLSLKMEAEFFSQKVHISTPLIGKGKKIEELLVKIVNKSELKGRKGQFKVNTL